jgi:hypothetical protein
VLEEALLAVDSSLPDLGELGHPADRGCTMTTDRAHPNCFNGQSGPGPPVPFLVTGRRDAHDRDDIIDDPVSTSRMCIAFLGVTLDEEDPAPVGERPAP